MSTIHADLLPLVVARSKFSVYRPEVLPWRPLLHCVLRISTNFGFKRYRVTSHRPSVPPLSLRAIADAVAAVLFPAPCRICGEILTGAALVPICPTCLREMQPLATIVCDLCGRPILSTPAFLTSRAICHLCRRGVYSFDRARSFGAYHQAMRLAVALLKYEGVVPLGKWFASRLEETLSNADQVFAPTS